MRSDMNIVVVGGNDCMACKYKEICTKYKCRAKVFTQMPADFENKLGSPDLVVVFTNTCSHKMSNIVSRKAAKQKFPVARIHSASASALHTVLSEYCTV